MFVRLADSKLAASWLAKGADFELCATAVPVDRTKRAAATNTRAGTEHELIRLPRRSSTTTVVSRDHEMRGLDEEGVVVLRSRPAAACLGQIEDGAQTGAK